MFGLNHLMGRYETIDTLDILNDPSECPDLDSVSNRARLERKFCL